MKTDSSAFSNLLDDFFTAYYLRRPVSATFIGMHDLDHLLPNFSEQSVTDTVNEMKALIARLDGLSEDDLTPVQSMDKKLSVGYLRTQLWEFQSDHFYKGNPCLYTGEAVFGVISLFLTDYAPVGERVEAAIDRMHGIAALLAQGQDNVRQAPQAWIEQAVDECVGALNFFDNGINQLIKEHGITDARFKTAALSAIDSYTRFKTYLENELRQHATQNYACGLEAFELMMRCGHFIELDLDEYVRYAEGQIAEAEAYLKDHAVSFGASSSEEALAQLAQIHPTVGKYYQRFGELWLACRKLAEEKQLVTWSDHPIEYVPQPLWARKAAPHLYFLPYRSPAAFNCPKVHRYLVPPIDDSMPVEKQEQMLRAVNDSVIKSNHVIHHGSIGHHVQNWNARRSASRIGQMAATDCASRLAMFCAGTMAEGWAVYVGDLMAEAGFLTPLEEYAEAQSRRRMSARAVVDIKLHRGEFTLEQAAAYYQTRGGMNADFAFREAVKNSMFPGAAMMYLFGSDRIKQFRKEMASLMGESFNLCQFHDTFLSYGSVPVELVCKDMKRMLNDAD
ncbi:MAG TPA: DUF885 family protein [Desulfuromonadaceae bacterium]